MFFTPAGFAERFTSTSGVERQLGLPTTTNTSNALNVLGNIQCLLAALWTRTILHAMKWSSI